MKQTIKDLFKKNKLTTIIYFVIFIIIVGWFYWFQFRPAQIRKECAESAKEGIQGIVKNGSCALDKKTGERRDEEKIIQCIEEIHNSLYDICLKRNGLIK